MNEIWELRDAEGNKAGISLPREDRDKIPEGLYLPCVEVWVTVGEKLLITRRHPRKSEGLKYEVSGGGARFGEELPDAALRELHEEVGIEAQTEQVCKNLCEVLAAAGTSINKAVKTTCFLADMSDFAAFNEVYGKYFISKPARSCVAAKQLPKGVLVEVEVIAEL